MPGTKRRLVIDTDVGSDDAIALILCATAELKGHTEIVGITCVHGNTSLNNVCINTLKVLKVINRLDIPVFRGTPDSIVETPERASNIHGGDGFGDFNYPDPPSVDAYIKKEHAVNYLTRIVAENPGELTLLALAPLTNVALAIRMDPAFCNNVKEIIIMGGNVEGVGNVTAAAEFNFHCDPEAAYIVIHNMKCPITIFPYETALRHGCIPYEWRKKVLGTINTPQMALVNKVESVLVDNELYGVWGRCDPIAAALTLYPDVATIKSRLYVTVELHGTNTRGALVVDHLKKLKKEPNVTIVQKINVELYKKILIDTFTYKL